MKKLSVLTMAIAALGLAFQVGTAEAAAKPRNKAAKIATLAVAGGATALWITKGTRHGHRWFRGKRFWKWYGLSSVGCMAVSPIVGAAIVHNTEGRELYSSEVFAMTGDCVVPIVGGLFWEHVFAQNPHWDRMSGRPTR